MQSPSPSNNKDRARVTRTTEKNQKSPRGIRRLGAALIALAQAQAEAEAEAQAESNATRAERSRPTTKPPKGGREIPPTGGTA